MLLGNLSGISSTFENIYLVQACIYHDYRKFYLNGIR